MLFPWQKNCLLRFLWCAAHVKLFFTSRKSSVIRTRQQLIREVICEMFISKAFWRPCRKNNISSYIWHTLFIQTVKCSFFSHKIVDQSFYGRCSRLVIFYFEEKFFVSHASASHLRVGCFQSVLKTLSKKNLCYIWHKLFIQTVKCSFFSHIIVGQSFYGLCSRLVIFYFEEKFFVSHTSASHLRDVCFQSVLKALSKK